MCVQILDERPTAQVFWSEFACQRKPVRRAAAYTNDATTNTNCLKACNLVFLQVLLGSGLMGDFASLEHWSDQYLCEKAVSILGRESFALLPVCKSALADKSPAQWASRAQPSYSLSRGPPVVALAKAGRCPCLLANSASSCKAVTSLSTFPASR